MTAVTEAPQEQAAASRNSGRLNVRINDDTARALTNLVVGDRSATEVVRRALALLDLVEQEQRDGKHLELVSSDNKSRERIRVLY